MGQVIELHLGDWKLQIVAVNEGWYQCLLVGQKDTYKLGAETLSYITTRLFTALCDHPEQEETGGESYRWVLSLADVHSSLYVVREGNAKRLLWQDANAKTLTEISLSPADCSDLCNQLKQVM